MSVALFDEMVSVCKENGVLLPSTSRDGGTKITEL